MINTPKRVSEMSSFNQDSGLQGRTDQRRLARGTVKEEKGLKGRGRDVAVGYVS